MRASLKACTKGTRKRKFQPIIQYAIEVVCNCFLQAGHSITRSTGGTAFTSNDIRMWIHKSWVAMIFSGSANTTILGMSNPAAFDDSGLTVTLTVPWQLTQLKPGILRFLIPQKVRTSARWLAHQTAGFQVNGSASRVNYQTTQQYNSI